MDKQLQVCALLITHLVCILGIIKARYFMPADDSQKMSNLICFFKERHDLKMVCAENCCRCRKIQHKPLPFTTKEILDALI